MKTNVNIFNALNESFNKEVKTKKKVLMEGNKVEVQNLDESAIEDHWDADEIDREGFTALLRCRDNPNNYYITIDANKAGNYSFDTDKEAIDYFRNVYLKKNESSLKKSKKSLKEAVGRPQDIEVEFEQYLKDNNIEEVTNRVINDYFSDLFYDIEDEDDLEDVNVAEDIIRKKYGNPTEKDESALEESERHNKEADDLIAEYFDNNMDLSELYNKLEKVFGNKKEAVEYFANNEERIKIMLYGPDNLGESERYAVYAIYGENGEYTSEKVAEVDNQDQAVDKVAELNAQGLNARYEKLEESNCKEDKNIKPNFHSDETLKEDEVIMIPDTEIETDYLINDVTVLDQNNDGDVQAPDIDGLLTLVNESLKEKYGENWGKINTFFSKINENSSYALVDITTPEILKEFENRGITDIAVGKNLILENQKNGLVTFKVNALNGTNRYTKNTTDPVATILEWVESEFLTEAKEAKIAELEAAKVKTEKETIQNYIETHKDLKMEADNIRMFIEMSKSIKDDGFNQMVQDRIYGFAAEFPMNIEISNKDDKYTLKFNSIDEVVEELFGKEWVKEVEIPEVITPLKESTESENELKTMLEKILEETGNLPDEIEYKGKTYRAFNNMSSDTQGETSQIYYCNMENTPNNDPQESNDYFFVVCALNKTDNGYKGINHINYVEDYTDNLSESVKLNESYEQFNIGDIEVVFNPDTYETLYSIPSADVKDKKINLTKIPSVETPYDTNTIIKSYIETRFGRIPTEEESKETPVESKKAPVETTQEIPTEVPEENQIEEDSLPEEPGAENSNSEEDIDVGVDIDNIDQETKESQAETGSARFVKIRPKQESNIEAIRERLLDGDTPETEYIIVDNIDLSDDQWNNMINNLSAPQSFLQGVKAIDRKNYSFNVVKVTNANSNFALLIDPLGYSYPRYLAIEE